MKIQTQYRNFHEISIDYLKKIIQTQSVPEPVLAKLLQYWESRLSNKEDPLFNDYFEYYLFFEFINSGILCSIIYDEKRKQIQHQYGILSDAISDILEKVNAISKRKQNRFIYPYIHNDHEFSMWLKRITSFDKSYLLVSIFPKNLNIEKRLDRFERVFVRYYIPDSLRPEKRFYHYFSNLKNKLIPDMNKFLIKKEPVTFTYFKFQSFNKYIYIGGESLGAELITGLAYQLTSRLKSGDRCYILNPREYLIVSFNCEKDIMEKRFNKLIFQVNSLILNYNVNYFTCRKKIDDIADYWSEIIGNKE